jgi:hypothetical protein
MAEEELGLEVIVRFLMQLFDCWHFPAFLGDFETIGDTDQALCVR